MGYKLVTFTNATECNKTLDKLMNLHFTSDLSEIIDEDKVRFLDAHYKSLVANDSMPANYSVETQEEYIITYYTTYESSFYVMAKSQKEAFKLFNDMANSYPVLQFKVIDITINPDRLTRNAMTE